MMWIRVEDALPKDGKRVLAYAIHDEEMPYLDASYFEAHHYDGCWYEEIDSCRIHVTHWMPLPELPHD